MSSVINIETCPVCGGRQIKQVFALPIAKFFDSGNLERVNYFNRLQISGHESMGYASCSTCSFTFASPTLDPALEMTTYNVAKAAQASKKAMLWADADAKALYQTHHKWVDLNPFIVGLGLHFDRFCKPSNPGQKPIKLLDIGCGFGHTLELARVFGVDGTGCDIDEARLAVCYEKGLNVGRPEDISGAFDVILSCNVIEHVYDIQAYIKMVKKNLEPNGVFVFNGVERSVIQIELRRKRFKLLHPIEHRNILTRQSLEKFLALNGLRLITRKEVFKTMLRVRSKAPLYLTYLLRSGFAVSNGVFSAIACHA